MQLLGPDFRNGMVKRVKLRQPSPQYGDFSTFQDGGRRHLGLLKCEILTIGRLNGAKLRRRAKLGRNPSNCDRDMVIFGFFKTETAAILDF